MRKYYSVTEVSDLYRIPRRTVLNMCHARGQKFAFQPHGGKYLIELVKFREYLDRRTRATEQRRFIS